MKRIQVKVYGNPRTMDSLRQVNIIVVDISLSQDPRSWTPQIHLDVIIKQLCISGWSTVLSSACNN